jgi:hypothetical protein
MHERSRRWDSREVGGRTSCSEADVTVEQAPTPEEVARKRARAYTALMWHIGVLVVINAFFWILDLGTGAEGL